jgi:hypothetical protein
VRLRTVVLSDVFRWRNTADEMPYASA